MSTFVNRLRYAAERAKVSQVELCAMTGIPKSAMSQYFSGAFKPKQTRTYLLASALGVDAAWLMGYDVPMIPKEKAPTAGESSERDELTGEILEELLKLPPKSQEEARKYIRFLAQQASEENP